MSSNGTPPLKICPQREDALTNDDHMGSPPRYEARLSEMGTPQAGPLTYVSTNDEGPPLPSVESLSIKVFPRATWNFLGSISVFPRFSP